MAYTFKYGDRPLDGYTIQRAVGRGGFGEVYYAISDGGREVALKYLRENPQVELRGVSHCINLKSPHLVSIFDVRKANDDNYVIIMEYCSGPSMRDLLIAEPNGFGPQKAAFFAREIGKGLSYLHDRGIVHRDLKPGNIFFDDGYVKIGDYGLSKFISVSRHSVQTASVGTVHYMAPEIGSGNYSRGVDIYALGVMLYEMLLGRVPFEGSSMAEVLMKHLTTQPELDDLPHPFGEVIRRALQKDPKDRYQTVDDMIGQLLEAEGLEQSLAGFSVKSLDGAVRVGGDAEARPGYDSPMPSPNPIPGVGIPFAGPVNPGAARQHTPPAPLPDRLNKRLQRAAKRVDQKMAKLAGRDYPQLKAKEKSGKRPAPPPMGGVDRRKRIAQSAFITLCLAIGFGVICGVTINEEAGASAGMLVVAMTGSVMLGHRAVRWFGSEDGPYWTRSLVQLCCAAPLLAIACAPLFDHSGYTRQAVGLWLALSAMAAFARWDKDIDLAQIGEMSMGSALWTAFGGLVFTSIAISIVDGNPDDFRFIGAGVAGLAAMILQASSWVAPMLKPSYNAGAAGAAAVPPPPPPYASPVGRDMAHTVALDRGRQADSGGHAPHQAHGRLPSERHDAEFDDADDADANPLLRWGVTRAFWALVAFGGMAGTIVTFVLAIIAEQLAYHDRTLAIILCTGFAALVIFALRKTTPVKRETFWRESIRPFLISLMLFGIGATTTAISREWRHVTESGSCLGDEGRAALITALVMCSLGLIGLTFFTGRKPRVRPFLRGEIGKGDRTTSFGSGQNQDATEEAPRTVKSSG